MAAGRAAEGPVPLPTPARVQLISLRWVYYLV